MEDMHIRRVRPDDLHKCHFLESVCFHPDEAADRQAIQTRIDTYPQGFLVAEGNKGVVGHVNSGATDKDDITDEAFKSLVGHDPAGRNLVIFSLAVLPEYRKKGIGQGLMDCFCEFGQQQEKEKVMLLCKSDLILYYKSLGFGYSGESSSTHGGFSWHEMILFL